MWSTQEIYQQLLNAAFLDIKGAFNNVIPNILVQELENIGIAAKIRMFILNLTSSRSLHFVVDRIGSFYSYKDVSQGCTLSPLLFEIYIYLKDIVKHLHQDSQILLYADDITIYSTSSKPLEFPFYRYRLLWIAFPTF